MSFRLDFSGQRVLITEGVRAIGYCAAKAFHELGAAVAINGRTGPEVDELIRSLGASPRLLAAPGDIATAAGRQRAVDHALDALGGLDILVNCSDQIADACINELSEPYWNRMLDSNVKSVFFVTQACLGPLKATRGSVINVAAATGLIAGPLNTAAYSAAKGAVIQMTRMLALHLANDGVRVNAVCPGWIDRESASRASGDESQSALSDMSDATPMGRAGTAEECAGAILYLAARLSGFTTGSILTVDGGLSAGH